MRYGKGAALLIALALAACDNQADSDRAQEGVPQGADASDFGTGAAETGPTPATNDPIARPDSASRR